MKNIITRPIDFELPRCGTSAVRAENLRRSPDGGIVPVGDIPSFRFIAGGTPVAVFSHTGGFRSFFFVERLTLSVITEDISSFSFSLKAPFRCAVTMADSVIIMTDNGPVILRFDDNRWREDNTDDCVPTIGFEPCETADYNEVTPARCLSGSYIRWSGALSARDSSVLSADISDALDRIAVKADADGRFIVPMALRYRIIHSSGTTVAVGHPVAVAADNGCFMERTTTSVAVSDGKYSSMDGFAVKAVGYRIRVRVNGTEDHIIHLSGGKDCFPVTLSDGQRLTVEITGEPIRLIDSRKPFTFSFGSSTAVSGSLISTPSRLKPSLPESVFRCDSLLSLPHRFSAGTGTSVGDCVVWGDITPLYSPPPSIAEVASSVIPSVAWSSVARVTLLDASGKTIVITHTESGDSNAPASLHPVIGYLHPFALSIEYQLDRADGTSLYCKIPLVNYPGRNFSAGMSDSLKPRPLSISDTRISPASSGKECRNAGVIAVAPVASPLSPVNTLEISPAAVTAATPASRTSSAWDFARRHFYIFTLSGTYAVAVNSSMSVISSHIIDRRPIDHGHAVAESPSGVYAATRDGIIRIKGSRAETIDSSLIADSVIWNPAHNELWALNTAGEITVIGEDNSICRRTALAGMEGIIPDSISPMLYKGSRLFDITGESLSQQPGPIKWSRRIDLRTIGGRRLAGAVWYISGSDLRISVTAAGDNGSSHPHLIASYSINGTVAAPVTMRYVTVPYRFITLTVDGLASADTVLSSVTLTLKP